MTDLLKSALSGILLTLLFITMLVLVFAFSGGVGYLLWVYVSPWLGGIVGSIFGIALFGGAFTIFLDAAFNVGYNSAHGKVFDITDPYRH